MLLLLLLLEVVVDVQMATGAIEIGGEVMLTGGEEEGDEEALEEADPGEPVGGKEVRT